MPDKSREALGLQADYVSVHLRNILMTEDILPLFYVGCFERRDLSPSI